MCIKSCKNSPFLKPTSPLNPSAQEWSPLHLHRHPPPPQTAAHVVAFAAHPPLKLLWHPMPYFPRAWSHIFYHSPPFPFPTGRYHAAAPPLFGGEVKSVENCVDKMEIPIVKGSSKGASKTWRPPPTAPPLRREWKPKMTVAGGGGAVSSPRVTAAPLIEELSSTTSRTTVMVKNIPNQLRRDLMLEFVDSYCNAHSLAYDFMYLPMDFRSEDNLGYAFVNFTNGENALKFKKILHNYKWETVKTDKGLYTSKKICAVTWARIQGKEKLVKRFENSTFACNNPNFLPVTFDPPRGGSNATSPPVIVGRLNVPFDPLCGSGSNTTSLR